MVKMRTCSRTSRKSCSIWRSEGSSSRAVMVICDASSWWMAQHAAVRFCFGILYLERGTIFVIKESLCEEFSLVKSPVG